MLIAIILALFGLLLIYLEFFLPGSVLVISGGIILLVSILVFGLMNEGLSLILFVFALGAALILTIKLALLQIKQSGKKGTIYLAQDQEGFRGATYPKEYVGKKGFVSNDLKPTGYIDVDGKVLSALSKRGYAEKGEEVEIIGGEGSYLIVK